LKKALILSAAVLVASLGGCAYLHGDPAAPASASSAGWKNLLASGVAGFNNVGDANWRMVDGALVADKGVGFLVTREAYGDFEMRAEFYAEADTNSGLFVRCQEKEKLTATVLRGEHLGRAAGARIRNGSHRGRREGQQPDAQGGRQVEHLPRDDEG
jgi:hypothetical protein